MVRSISLTLNALYIKEVMSVGHGGGGSEWSSQDKRVS